MVKVIDYNNHLNVFLKDYKYQPDLTKKLDEYKNMQFDQSIINEMVLWKVNRYVKLPDDILKSFKQLKNLKNREHRKAMQILLELLKIHGVDLPMASTFLRFYSPDVFQIVDRHAYRAVYGKDYPLYTGTAIEKKAEIYFKYLDDLIRLCQEKQLKFKTIDRLLYEYDKQVNKGKKIT